jgi:RecB family exonuclease
MTEPVRIRASSLGSLMDCPARWLAVHREGRRVPSSSQAQLGRAVHAGTAHFDTERVAGQTPSITAAMDAAVQTAMTPNEDVDWQEETPARAADVAKSLTERYCRDFAPSVEYAAVEIGVDELHLTDLNIVLAGTADRVRKTDAGLGISDLKTGKTIVDARGHVSTKGHGAQLGVYQLLAEAGMQQAMTAPAQIIGLQTNLTPDKQRIAAAEIEGVRDVLVGDADQPGLLHVAARLAHGELTFGNPKSMMCSARYCPNFNQCFWRK